ncbi:hypothetical protein GmHk_04G009560 [Glycine max]|nr:hypothetical protein GmHk_04G009560 [Glycine max]
MNGKVNDEDIQEGLSEAALIPNLNRQQWVIVSKEERNCILTKQEKKFIILKLFDYVVCFGSFNLQNNS